MMGSPKEDIAAIGAAGWWEGERDPLLSAVTLLLMYAKPRHQPRYALHKLANALEEGNVAKATRFYERLKEEVAH